MVTDVPTESTGVHGRRFFTSWARLALTASGILWVGFFLLPWLAQQPTVKTRINFLEARKINGNATFYTDHEFLEDILASTEARITR